MILNLHSLAFGTETASGGGNPAWGTEMGQGEGYRFSFENCENLITAMVYNSIPNPQDRIYCPLGKGGNQSSDYEFVLGSLFKKVFVNGIPVNGKFLLLIVKKLVGDNHVGRKTLKYNPRMTLDDVNYNENCYNNMATALGVSRNGSWFVSEINVKNQDELHFTAHVLNADAPTIFSDSADRSQKLQSKLLAYAQESNNPKFKTYIKSLIFDSPLQVIYYGAPGTGKSHRIKDFLTKHDVPKRNIFRTTFHPDSDYSTFVGSYKPSRGKKKMFGLNGSTTVAMEYNGQPLEEEIISYQFIPQAFLQAYIQAYKNPEEKVFLVIEEINRGNCAQIFGDLFQLLDRDDSGKSEYPIKADTDMKQFLEKELGTDNEGIAEGELCLPSNLYIFATMNTSDQSLFPIDSAFKRRWDWEYEPIKYKNTDWMIDIDGVKYLWVKFQKEVNSRILSDTGSEDKMMGDYFVKPNSKVISKKLFLNKILFYLWNDVCKDGGAEIFPSDDDFSFSSLYNEDSSETLHSIMKNLGIQYEEASVKAEGEEKSDSGSEDENSKRHKYSINGSSEAYSTPKAVRKVIQDYALQHPDKSVVEMIQFCNKISGRNNCAVAEWAPSENDNQPFADKRRSEIRWGDGKAIWITNGWTNDAFKIFIDNVKKQLGIMIEEVK